MGKLIWNRGGAASPSLAVSYVLGSGGCYCGLFGPACRFWTPWEAACLEEEPRPVPGALGVNAGLDWPLVDREEALEALAAVVPAEAAEPPAARVGVRFSPSVFMVQIGLSVLENGARGTPRAPPNGLSHIRHFTVYFCLHVLFLFVVLYY